jgi:hypothetical protein
MNYGSGMLSPRINVMEALQMTGYPLTLAEVVSWFRSKQNLLVGSAVSLAGIRERTDYLPAAAADFDGPGTIGRINGWVSGAFDFEALRVSDGKDIFWRHVDVSTVDELETAYADFLQILHNPG